MADHADKAACTGEVVGVAGRYQKGEWRPASSVKGVDLGRLPAARTADGVVERPPFAPAAERWALMWVESMAADPYMPVEPVRA